MNDRIKYNFALGIQRGLRDVPATQDVKFPEGNPIPSNSLSKGLNKLTVLVQQLLGAVGRKVGLSATSTYAGYLDLPVPIASRSLKWALDGLSIVNSDSDPDTVVAAVTASAAAATGAAATATDKAGIATTAAGIAGAAAEAAQAAAASVGDPLQKAQNLADLPDKPAARTALSVYSQAEIDSAIAAAGVTAALLERIDYLERANGVQALRLVLVDGKIGPTAMLDEHGDMFEDQTGIAALGGATYDATGDYIHNPGGISGYTADLTAGETAISSTTGGGATANLINDNTTDYWYSAESGAATVNTSYVGASFATPRHIRRVTITHGDVGGGTASVPTGLAVRRKVAGTWTTVATVVSAQVLTKQTFDLPASDAQSEWSVTPTAAGTNNWPVAEIEMMEGIPTAPADITTVSAASAAAAGSTDNEARLVILHQPVDAVTLNTDIIAEISRDDGVTWSAAALANDGAFDATTNILTGVADISAQPAGTAMRWRVRTCNSKEQRLHGVWMQWR